ncbi:unnamed protein product [Calypogeia fissa]
MDKKGPLFKSLTILDKGAARLNDSFRVLREIYKWQSVGIVETRPVTLEKFNYEGLVVEEGSARHDVDVFYTASGTDHFDICRPESTTSSSFLHLMTLITDLLKEDKDRQGPKLTSTHQVVGVDHQVKTVRDRLAEEPRLGIFGLGGIDESRIFVTTRNREIFAAEGFQAISVATLRDEDAENLFCRYAFKKQPRGFENLVQGFVDKCGGYPLALEISGKYLCGKPEKIWHEVLQKLSTAKPINGGKTDAISLILDSSYKDLGTPARQMFLDVAHLFHGEKLSTVKRIWKLCGWGAETGWRTLLDRGLVTEVPLKSFNWRAYRPAYPDSTYERDSKFAIQMHELLCDYGKSNGDLCPEPEKLHADSQECPMEFWKIGFNDSKFNILQEMDDSENPSRSGASCKVYNT